MNFPTGPKYASPNPAQPSGGAHDPLRGIEEDGPRRDAFLRTLELTGSVTRSAAAAGLSLSSCYKARKRSLELRAAWTEALEVALDGLIGVGMERACEGVARPLISGGEAGAGPGRPADVGAGLRVHRVADLMKFHFGDRLADRLRVSVDGPLALEPQYVLLMPPEARQALVEGLRCYAAIVQGERQREIGHAPEA